VIPLIDRYLRAQKEAIADSFPGAPSFVVHSGGGMMTVARARLLPLATVMSGPAAGVAATARLARRFGLARAVSVDMGGTSTDVCLLRDGIPVSARDRRLGGHVVRLPAVAVESIGAGGGSVAWVDDVGALRVGPRSAGAVPGPAAYGRGGAGPMHAGAVALSAGVERVLVPALSSTFSALGCCLSELAIDDVRTCLARLDQVDWPRVERELEGLVGEISATLENDRGALRVF